MAMARSEKIRQKNQAIRSAEESGQVADSTDVRKKLMERVHSGELTLAQAQEELKRVQKSAKKNGQLTRSQAYRNG